ncbi:MAG TPA: hypothetical protein VNX40_00710 [Mucilaginibacter sp.]|jgi:hypothetical protein|nr:hypothetical protein [Mucilaginibacter sp.]
MLIPASNFSYKSSCVGAIIGMSIGLGMLSVDLGIFFAAVLALFFGYRPTPITLGRKIDPLAKRRLESD